MVARVSALVFGNNQSTSGPMMREVLPALKLSEEAKEINASQTTSGRYRLSSLATSLKRRGAGNDFDDLVCDRCLTNAVHVERQSFDQLTRILRSRVHRGHACTVLGCNRLQQRAKDLRLQQARQEHAEHLFGWL